MLLQGSRMPAVKICCYGAKRFVRFLHLFMLRYAHPGRYRKMVCPLREIIGIWWNKTCSSVRGFRRMNQFPMLLDNPFANRQRKLLCINYYTCSVFGFFFFLYNWNLVYDANCSSQILHRILNIAIIMSDAWWARNIKPFINYCDITPREL